jgi:hypothetical protein
MASDMIISPHSLHTLFPVKKSEFVGELKLQSCEAANIFYSEHIQNDMRIGEGDYSKKGLWQPAAFTHQTKKEEDVVVVDGNSTILQGHFKDKIGEANQGNWEYTITVYVWIETEGTEEIKGGNK